MKLFKKYIVSAAMVSLFLTFMTQAFALDQMAKEETTPPPAEGALSVDQIPPMYSSDKNSGAAPAQAPSAE